jgi:hypothetical protein
MYTLAKQFASSSVAIEGGDNWLSDINETAVNIELRRRLAASQQPDTKFGTDNSKPPATEQPRPLTEEQQNALPNPLFL